MILDYAVICLVSLAAAGLTLFSGFGLGTVLTPVMAIFFPVETAIAMTAIVHFANNLFKFSLFYKLANLGVVLRFGIPAFFASVAGAWLLLRVADMAPLFTYTLAGGTFEISPVKLLIGLLIGFFALQELRPKTEPRRYPASWLPLGGLLSGFFGGLSGNQGAFRSAFLLGAGLSKESFIATGVVLACVVDASRLGVYGSLAGSQIVSDNLTLLALATACAFLGSFVGSRVLKKITIATVRAMVGGMLLLLAAGLCLGFI